MKVGDHVGMSRVLTIALILTLACKSEAPPPPREEFHWTEQAVSFVPPPQNWRREGELSGGVKGVRFVKERGLGEAITVGELHHVADRSRAAAIEKLLEELDALDQRDFLDDLSLARMRTDDFYSDAEADVARDVNDALDRAMRAHLDNDVERARAELEAAYAAAERLHFTLDDMLESGTIEERDDRRDLTIGGHRAVAFAWTMPHDGRTYQRRELYVMHENHLFTARFIGLGESLELFNRVVESMEFSE